MFGAEITSHQNLAKVPGARNFAMAELSKAGVEFHSYRMPVGAMAGSWWLSEL